MIGQQTNIPIIPLTPPFIVHLFVYSFLSFPPPSHLTFPAQLVSYLSCFFSIFTPDLEGSKAISRHWSLSAHCSPPYCDVTTNRLFLTLPAIARCSITRSSILRCVVLKNFFQKKKDFLGVFVSFVLLFLVSGLFFLVSSPFVSFVFCSVLLCFSVGSFLVLFLSFCLRPFSPLFGSLLFAVS